MVLFNGSHHPNLEDVEIALVFVLGNCHFKQQMSFLVYLLYCFPFLCYTYDTTCSYLNSVQVRWRNLVMSFLFSWTQSCSWDANKILVWMHTLEVNLPSLLVYILTQRQPSKKANAFAQTVSQIRNFRHYVHNLWSKRRDKMLMKDLNSQ